MKRRTFIWTPLLLSLAPVLRPDAHASTVTNQASKECMSLLRCFSNPAEAAEVGQRYLADRPELADIDKLTRDVGLHDANSDARVAMTANVQFEAAKRHDFTVGNTVCLEGWIVSKAEASLCALAYLSPTNV